MTQMFDIVYTNIGGEKRSLKFNQEDVDFINQLDSKLLYCSICEAKNDLANYIEDTHGVIYVTDTEVRKFRFPKKIKRLANSDLYEYFHDRSLVKPLYLFLLAFAKQVGDSFYDDLKTLIELLSRRDATISYNRIQNIVPTAVFIATKMKRYDLLEAWLNDEESDNVTRIMYGMILDVSEFKKLLEKKYDPETVLDGTLRTHSVNFSRYILHKVGNIFVGYSHEDLMRRLLHMYHTQMSDDEKSDFHYNYESSRIDTQRFMDLLTRFQVPKPGGETFDLDRSW